MYFSEFQLNQDLKFFNWNKFSLGGGEVQLQHLYFMSETCALLVPFNPISTGLFYLVVAREGSFPPPSIKFDPDILEH